MRNNLINLWKLKVEMIGERKNNQFRDVFWMTGKYTLKKTFAFICNMFAIICWPY
jgi:hypothetical protein